MGRERGDWHRFTFWSYQVYAVWPLVLLLYPFVFLCRWTVSSGKTDIFNFTSLKAAQRQTKKGSGSDIRCFLIDVQKRSKILFSFGLKTISKLPAWKHSSHRQKKMLKKRLFQSLPGTGMKEYVMIPGNYWVWDVTDIDMSLSTKSCAARSKW